MIDKSEDFRAGMAFAAHSILHAVGHAHGQTDRSIVEAVEPRYCCQEAILAFAQGTTDTLIGGAGTAGDDHSHTEAGAHPGPADG